MLSKREVGNKGEALALSHLESCGHQILETNWRYSRAEIDIISKSEELLVFTEVKTRTYTYYGQPSDAVGPAKEALLIDAAQRYMEQIGYDWEIRFDIISVILDKSGLLVKLEHFEDAFF